MSSTPKLAAPSYKKIAYIGANNTGKSLTLINLGSYKTIISISEGDIIATGTINSNSVSFIAIESIEIGSSQLYVLLSGINYSGNVSLTITSGLTDGSITINEDDCYNIYSIYFGEDFENITNVNTVCNYSNTTPTISNSDIQGQYLSCSSNSNKVSSINTIFNLNIPENDTYILEFEAGISTVNNNQSGSIFYLLTDSSSTDSYILKMYSNTYNNGSNNLTWIINDSDTSVSYPSSFYHYKLYVDRNTNQIALSIFSLDGNIILNKKIIEKSSSVTTDIINCFLMSIGKGARGGLKLDNISIYTYENAAIIPTFTSRSITIDLSTYNAISLSSVNLSKYVNSSLNGKKITITSIKEGNTYIYVEGIISGNINVYFLIPITVDERGILSYENILVIGTSTSFDKNVIVIEDVYNTSSAVGDLDTSEPPDLPSVTPSVNVNEVNEKIASFDSDNDILPRVKVGYCITSNTWYILYTTDNTINEYSEYIPYSTSYEGLLDCLNVAQSLLTNGRNSKEKICVITNGSTGTASQNKNSKVSSSNRMYNSVSYKISSYTIIDFLNHTIYCDMSESFTSNNITYNILAFIDMERGVHDSSIRNLTFTGTPTYSIFIAQSYRIIMNNIYVGVAKGEVHSAGIGIRAQSQANAIANVDLSRWSHDLYFDNIRFDGTEEHGIETFNAYNIYMGTIKVTDASVGCGVLLNCSYNVWINKIIGIRCCTSATYAALRLANDCGPNVNVHYVYGEACGNGVFLVSSSNGITIDKINLVNTHSSAVYVGGSAGLHIKSGIIQTNGETLTYCNNKGEIGTTVASTGNGIFLVNGSSSQFMPQWNDIFENIKIKGYKCGYSERYNMSANYSIYSNIDTTECQNIKEASSSGTGTDEDIGFCFAVIDGVRGDGNDKTSGDLVINGDYTYILDEGENTYIIYEYTGNDNIITLPSKFNNKIISRIGDFAFFGNKNLKSVTIPKNISFVGDLSFGDCELLQSVIFNSGGSYEIGHCAFRRCNSLINLDLTGVTILRNSCFALCSSLRTVICPSSVVYFGANCFYNDNINLTIKASDTSLMTVEPYAFYFIGRNSSITFTSLTGEPSTLKSIAATGSNSYYYNSQSYVEKNVYTANVWCKYWYHVAVPPQFST